MKQRSVDFRKIVLDANLSPEYSLPMLTNTAAEILRTAEHTLAFGFTRSTFSIKGRRYELMTRYRMTPLRGCSDKAGQTEVYVEYADEPGLMEFRGYYADLVMVDAALCGRIHPVLQAHVGAHSTVYEPDWSLANARRIGSGGVE